MDAAVSLPVMNAMEDLFRTVTVGRISFAEWAENLPGTPSWRHELAGTCGIWNDLERRPMSEKGADDSRPV